MSPHLCHLFGPDGVPFVALRSSETTDDHLLCRLTSCSVGVNFFHRTEPHEGTLGEGEAEELQKENADVENINGSERTSREEPMGRVRGDDERPKDIVVAVSEVVS
jgi:hypothetical protein